MREAKTFSMAEAFAGCLTTWYLNGRAITKTAEKTPPEVGETFRLGFKDYSVLAVFGPYSYRWASATIVPKEADPCA